MQKRIIEVVGYDPQWAEAYRTESIAVQDVLKGLDVRLHHIGSTSVPGLMAKPVIDILIEANDVAELDGYDAAMKAIVDNGWGCLLYLRQEGRGIGLHAKIQAYHLQDQGADTLDANLILGHPADGRNYQIAATMLNDLGITDVALLTNNPDKVKQLEDHGIVVAKTVPLVAGVGEDNLQYLQTKVQRMGHTIDSDELE